MRLALFVIVAILLLGLLFKLLKFAIILALGVGVVVLTQRLLEQRRLK